MSMTSIGAVQAGALRRARPRVAEHPRLGAGELLEVLELVLPGLAAEAAAGGA